MKANVRTIAAEEMTAWLGQRGVGFMRHEPEGMSEFFLAQVDLDRTRGAFDGPAVVGTLRSFATDLTVPGLSTVRASALTNVTVAPTHRRNGVLTAMITEDLRDSAARGEAVSILIASEYPIYGRFGYGAATDVARYELVHDQTRFRQPSRGSVELVDLPGLRREAPRVYDRFRAAQIGAISRGDDWWDRATRTTPIPGAEPRKGFQAIYRSTSGEVDGYVLYEGKLDSDDMRKTGTLTVEELTAVTTDAYQALWSFCCGVDLLTKSLAANRAVDELLPLLLEDGRALRLLGQHDFLWIRILDVAVALGARTYAEEGRLVLDVVDDLGLTSGRFALEAGGPRASCTTTSEEPDLVVHVASLGAAYLGGTSWMRLRAAARVTECKDGAIERADRLFASSGAPWCNTWF
jgi:predicted acetyltransferase